MNHAEFARAIDGLPLARAEFFETIGSTNDVVAAWAAEGAVGPCLAAADEQTQGRGREGRRWHTPAGSALALSLLLPAPQGFEASQLGRVSGLGALAVCETLEAMGVAAEIKWPNDVLAGGRKLCGVLPEAHWTGSRLQALILGIGINVAAQSVPADSELSFPATSVEAAAGPPLICCAACCSACWPGCRNCPVQSFCRHGSGAWPIVARRCSCTPPSSPLWAYWLAWPRMAVCAWILTAASAPTPPGRCSCAPWLTGQTNKLD